MKIRDVLQLSGSAMNAQSTRLRVIAENIANSETLDDGKGAPYRRKLTVLQAELGRRDDIRRVTVRDIGTDPTDGQKRLEPGHPRADAAGYVTYPNVNPIIEMNDLRDADRSYRANLQVIDTAKRLFRNAIDLMKG
jgi:flagellar basal-body rod protein FlgC